MSAAPFTRHYSKRGNDRIMAVFTLHLRNMQTLQHESKAELHHLQDVDKDANPVRSQDDAGATRFPPAPGKGLRKSRFDELSIPMTLWVFRRAAMFCFFSLSRGKCWMVRR